MNNYSVKTFLNTNSTKKNTKFLVCVIVVYKFNFFFINLIKIIEVRILNFSFFLANGHLLEKKNGFLSQIEKQQIFLILV